MDCYIAATFVLPLVQMRTRVACAMQCVCLPGACTHGVCGGRALTAAMLQGEEESNASSRNVLVESARIARGQVSDVGDLSATDETVAAVLFPGGFGAAKNLCDFGVRGPEEMTVREDVKNVLLGFHKAGKPIGLCCIAPVLAAKVFPGVAVTVGSDKEDDPYWPFAGAAKGIEVMGAKHVAKNKVGGKGSAARATISCLHGATKCALLLR